VVRERDAVGEDPRELRGVVLPSTDFVVRDDVLIGGDRYSSIGQSKGDSIRR